MMNRTMALVASATRRRKRAAPAESETPAAAVPDVIDAAEDDPLVSERSLLREWSSHRDPLWPPREAL